MVSDGRGGGGDLGALWHAYARGGRTAADSHPPPRMAIEQRATGKGRPAPQRAASPDDSKRSQHREVYVGSRPRQSVQAPGNAPGIL